MIWQDIVVRRRLDDHDLVRGIAAGFGVNPRDVLVHRGTDDFPAPGDAKIVCLASDRPEGFRTVISLYTYFNSPRHDEPTDVVKTFARTTQTECLLTDDSADPYTMMRVEPSGDSGRVNLDIDRLDDKGEYIIRE